MDRTKHTSDNIKRGYKNTKTIVETQPEGTLSSDALEQFEQKVKEENEGHEIKGMYTAGELLDMNLSKIPCLIEPIFQKVGLVALVGSSDTGKSTLLRQLALCVCNEESFLEWEINALHRSAIYVSTEDSELALAVALQKQNNGSILPPDARQKLRFIINWEIDLCEHLDNLLTMQPADLVVIDAFADVFSGKLNENNQVRNFLNDFSRLANSHQCLIVFLHHTKKNTDDQKPSKHNSIGSQGFEAKMRVLCELRKDPYEPGLRHLCVVKGNYLPDAEKNKSYVLAFGENLLFEFTGDRVPFDELGANASGRTRRASEEEIGRARKLKQEGKTIKEIARELDRSEGWVSNHTRNINPNS